MFEKRKELAMVVVPSNRVSAMKDGKPSEEDSSVRVDNFQTVQTTEEQLATKENAEGILESHEKIEKTDSHERLGSKERVGKERIGREKKPKKDIKTKAGKRSKESRLKRDRSGSKEKITKPRRALSREKTVTNDTSLDLGNSQEEESESKGDKENCYRTMIPIELTALQKRTWYHGLMPRDEIEHILQQDGQFLVRKTEVGKGEQQERLTLSVRWKGRVRHILIRLNKENKWAFIPECGFDSIEKLISFYMLTKGEIQKEGTKLLTPAPRPDWYLLHSQITTKKKLGNGHFGEVFLGELHTEEKTIEVAVKMLKGKMGKKERSDFMKEAAIQRKFKNAHVVGLLGIAPTEEPFMVVLEYCPGGDLRNHLRNTSKNDPFIVLNKYLVDAGKGMEYLHALDVIHRDLAARNCLLSADFTVKVSDFGLSVKTKDLRDQKKQKMAVKWMAPEVLRSYTFSKATDVWAFGILMWEVYKHGKLDPYPDKTTAEVRKMLLETKTRMEIPSDLPPQIQDIMKECWAENPKERPSMRDVVTVLSGGTVLMPKKMKHLMNKLSVYQ
ncbi:unnamed protein product [Bursaphelenchus xylophilus]|uniref:Tyrosine-protein kinase n=1 Tax=Bursaphelenchus xylophilus TaxID=6326 RepID=A0A1I7SCJ2_BURXY|nr:unnamed protein product [Bursaphelenchus xylophilus]CAG9094006.1 unnamed protein product [Bursaphelenchus xylophilus]